MERGGAGTGTVSGLGLEGSGRVLETVSWNHLKVWGLIACHGYLRKYNLLSHSVEFTKHTKEY